MYQKYILLVMVTRISIVKFFVYKTRLLREIKVLRINIIMYNIKSVIKT